MSTIEHGETSSGPRQPRPTTWSSWPEGRASGCVRTPPPSRSRWSPSGSSTPSSRSCCASWPSRGFCHATLAIGHLGQLIRAYVADGSQWGIEVDYVNEESPLGTIGPALMALDRLPEHFLLMNGDILTDLDYADLMNQHVDGGAPLTVATYERVHHVDFGVLEVVDRKITNFTEKPPMTYSVSMGIYGVSKRHLERYTPGLPYGFDELMLDLIERGRCRPATSFDGFWLDIGRPDDYDRANREFEILGPRLLPGLRR